MAAKRPAAWLGRCPVLPRDAERPQGERLDVRAGQQPLRGVGLDPLAVAQGDERVEHGGRAVELVGLEPDRRDRIDEQPQRGEVAAGERQTESRRIEHRVRLHADCVGLPLEAPGLGRVARSLARDRAVEERGSAFPGHGVLAFASTARSAAAVSDRRAVPAACEHLDLEPQEDAMQAVMRSQALDHLAELRAGAGRRRPGRPGRRGREWPA